MLLPSADAVGDGRHNTHFLIDGVAKPRFDIALLSRGELVPDARYNRQGKS